MEVYSITAGLQGIHELIKLFQFLSVDATKQKCALATVHCMPSLVPLCVGFYESLSFGWQHVEIVTISFLSAVTMKLSLLGLLVRLPVALNLMAICN